MDMAVGYLSVVGPAVVRAKHIRLPPGLKLVDAEQYICSVADNVVLSAKVHIS